MVDQQPLLGMLLSALSFLAAAALYIGTMSVRGFLNLSASGHPSNKGE